MSNKLKKSQSKFNKKLFKKIDNLIDSDANYEVNQYVLNPNYVLPDDFFKNIMTLDSMKQKRATFMNNYFIIIFIFLVSVILIISGIANDKKIDANPTALGIWVTGVILFAIAILYLIIVNCVCLYPITKSFKYLSKKMFYLQDNNVIKPIDNSYPELVFMFLFLNKKIKITLWRQYYQKFPVMSSYEANVGLIVFLNKLKALLDNKSNLIKYNR